MLKFIKHFFTLLLKPFSRIRKKLVAGEPYYSPKLSWKRGLGLLKEGNKRFYSGELIHPHQNIDRVKLVATSDQQEHAFAAVVGCSDSRVPPEIIFDRGLMDLFVIRTAGNILDTHEVASIEYAVKYLNIKLLIYMGHRDCGAVKAAIHFANEGKLQYSENISKLLTKILPAVTDGEALPRSLDDAIEQNLWRNFSYLMTESSLTRNLVLSGEVKVVLGVFDVKTGKVNCLSDKKLDASIEQFR